MTWLPLICVLATSIEVSERARLGAHEMGASAQLGAGELTHEEAALALPRLWYRHRAVEAALAVPLWLSLRDGTPLAPFDWRSATTYLGFLERLELGSSEAAYVRAGALVQERFGSGMLVDSYGNRLDMTSRNTGLSARWRGQGVDAQLLASRLVDPTLLAARVAVAPLAWAGVGDGERLRLSIEGALDPRAPEVSGKAYAGGGALGLELVAYQGTRLGIALFGGGAMLHGGALGQELGMRSDVLLDTRGRAGMSVSVTAVHRGEDYEPHYFDALYDAERLGIVRGVAAKRTWTSPKEWNGEFRLVAYAPFVHLGLAARSDLRRQGEGEAFVEVSGERYRVSAALIERRLARFAEVVERAPSLALLDGSVLVWNGVFAFTSVSRSVRAVAPAGPAQATFDWMVGFGYGARDDLSS